MAAGRGLSPYLYVALALPVIIGVVAAVLAGTLPSPAGPHSGELIINLPDQVWGLLFLSPLLVGLTAILVRRIVGPSLSFERRGLVVVLAVALLALLFIAVFSHGGSSGGSVGVASPGSGGSGGAHGINTTGHNNTSGGGQGSGGSGQSSGSTGVGSGGFVNIPGWAMLAVVVALCVCVIAVAVPGVISAVHRIGRREPRSARASDADRAEAQQAVYEASQALVRGEDPRTTIIRLYLRLLARLGPRLGDSDQYTAEEIRTLVLAPLLVRPDAAEALTRLFEEARYSVHLLGPEAADRCRNALGLVEADLARAGRGV